MKMSNDEIPMSNGEWAARDHLNRAQLLLRLKNMA
jgi:hypothetical protein